MTENVLPVFYIHMNKHKTVSVILRPKRNWTGSKKVATVFCCAFFVCSHAGEARNMNIVLAKGLNQYKFVVLESKD